MPPTIRKPGSIRRFLAFGLGALAVAALGTLASVVCLPAWIGRAILVSHCPSGTIRQTLRLSVEDALRGGTGRIYVDATAHFTGGDADWADQTPVRRFAAELFLVDAEGREQPLKTKDDKGLESLGFTKTAEILLPEVPDGDYRLRAKVRSPIEAGSIDVPLALYAPARIHVITDRPLYQPGQVVRFRALVLRGIDLSPLDGRPGKFFVEDPGGETVLEEKAPAGAFGIIAAELPLDRDAATGSWRVRWQSGPAEGSATFRVEPFRLPRFSIEAEATAPFFVPLEHPKVRGNVTYASGAPVAKASLTLEWAAEGDWPPPASWQEGDLPKALTAGADGRFEIELPAVPSDLRGQVQLRADLTALDASGDRVAGVVEVLLSEDRILVSAVTELADGLVDGFNNRVFLRATTAAGRPLPNTELTVRRAWEASDPGIVTTTDEDGVAALQLDPGPPINVVLPPMPVRPPPKEPSIVRSDVLDLVSGEDASLADQRVMDGWTPALAPCARFADEEEAAAILAVRVEAGGRVSHVGPSASPLARCLVSAIRGRNLPPGTDRLYRLELSANAQDLPGLAPEVQGAPFVLDALTAALEAASRDARGCLAADTTADGLPHILVWRTEAKSKAIAVDWVRAPPDRRPEQVPPANQTSCLEARFRGLSLPEEASDTTLGTAIFSITPAPRRSEGIAEATTVLGYELAISARAGKEELGHTRLIQKPGSIPAIRLRATPVVAKPGDTITVEVLRGPGFSGKLPEKLWLGRPGIPSIESKLDEKTRVATFTLPAKAGGWYEANLVGARAVVFVPENSGLSVDLRPEKDRYAPKDMARLFVETKVAGQPAASALTLIGVDQSLSQLAPLPGVGELEGLRPKVTTTAPAFGALDGQALVMGRIRGANAAQATVLRVSALPPAEARDLRVSASLSTPFDPLEALTDHFYAALAELHAEVQRWEKEAPKDEKINPRKMAELWSKALTRAEGKGVAVDDAFGRRLRLHRLPPDLLALTAPHAVVAEGTRLPEDVEDWARWVQKERP